MFVFWSVASPVRPWLWQHWQDSLSSSVHYSDFTAWDPTSLSHVRAILLLAAVGLSRTCLPAIYNRNRPVICRLFAWHKVIPGRKTVLISFPFPFLPSLKVLLKFMSRVTSGIHRYTDRCACVCTQAYIYWEYWKNFQTVELKISSFLVHHV